MIKNPVLVVIFLLGIEAGVLFISSRPRCRKYFSVLPSIFWMYFLPMVFSTAGLIDSQSQVYKLIAAYVLPMSLVLLLLSADLSAIARLGRQALMMMLAGTLGIMIAVPLVFTFFKPLVGPAMWPGFGALSASWTGGSANMIAVREALRVPSEVFTPMVLVDTVVPYVWMALLVSLAGFQKAFDRWNRVDKKIFEVLAHQTAGIKVEKKTVLDKRGIAMVFFVGIAGVLFSAALAQQMPSFGNVFTPAAWRVILASALGVVLSLTPLKKLERYGTDPIGYFLLFFVLVSIGAGARLVNIGTSLVLIMAGFCIVIIHGVIVLGVSRLIRAPFFLVVVSSQANIGGVASAPVVAGVYQPHLSYVGLLLAVFGNIIGTYVGIITGYVCRYFSGGS
ncbi:MAG: DUF819 family protein [Candidatus Omnitrophota bacterium]|jgi:uncharacterized membrane protein